MLSLNNLLVRKPTLISLVCAALTIAGVKGETLPAPEILPEETFPPSGNNLVDVRTVAPTIVIDLRYAGPNNFTRRALYPTTMPPLVQFSVAERLAVAQEFLKPRGYRLKIWDAYRPKTAQAMLWAAI